MLEYAVNRSATEAKETDDASRNMIPLILDALREKERHSTTRMILGNALCNITAKSGYPEYRPEFHQILLDDAEECLSGRGRFGPMPLSQMLVDPKQDFSDTIKEMSSWAGFQEEIKRPSLSHGNESMRTIDLSQEPSGNILHLSSKPFFPAEDSFETYSEPVRAPQKIGRNDPCPCGSGKKYKKCCME